MALIAMAAGGATAYLLPQRERGPAGGLINMVGDIDGDSGSGARPPCSQQSVDVPCWGAGFWQGVHSGSTLIAHAIPAATQRFLIRIPRGWFCLSNKLAPSCLRQVPAHTIGDIFIKCWTCGCQVSGQKCRRQQTWRTCWQMQCAPMIVPWP